MLEASTLKNNKKQLVNMLAPSLSAHLVKSITERDALKILQKLTEMLASS